MRLGIIFLFWISAVFACAQAAPAANGHSADEQALRQLNEDVLKAYNLGDVKTLDKVEDSDFVLSGDFGEIPWAQHLDKCAPSQRKSHKRARICRECRVTFLWGYRSPHRS
jgi:hypothetical protein